MDNLVSIDGSVTNPSASLGAQRITAIPVLVVFPHNQCNCRCTMCDIWRERDAREITLEDLELQLESLKKLNVKWVVLSGGEPQLNAQFSEIARKLRRGGVRITLLTAGLLLQDHAEIIADVIDDLIVSLDGPAAIHNQVRRVENAFERMVAGIEEVRRYKPDIRVGARCTVQKANHCSLVATARAARQAGMNSISFLAADLTSNAFNRKEKWSPLRQTRVALNAEELNALEDELTCLIEEYGDELGGVFVAESAVKLRRIALHFRAYLGLAAAVAPRCNAPWVSAVIEASGDVRPCFFHAAIGNIHAQPLEEIVNGTRALRFRAELNVANNPTCRQCVCSLHLDVR